MSSQKNSIAKISALAASTVLHIAGIYYLGTIALDYALPEGTVDSMEMSYDINQGVQTESTEVSVVDTPEQAPKVQAPPAPAIKPAAPKAEAPAPALLPTKEQTSESPVTQEESPVEVPVVAPAIPSNDVSEDLLKDTAENDKTKDVPANDPMSDGTPEPLPTVDSNTPPKEDALPAATQTAAQNAQSYGRPEGIQSDKVLTPMTGNKGINYPNIARLRRIEGTTIVHYTVSPEGLVTDTKIAQSSGSSILDNSALDTIKTWKFKPTGEAGIYERPIRFKLTGDATEAPGQLRRNN